MKISAETLKLYAVTDSSWLKGESLADAVEKAIHGGVTIVQYREKLLDYDAQLSQAIEVRRICRRYNVPFIMNDSVELAIATDADGVHLGLDDGDLLLARKRLGEGKIIGASTHNAAEAIAAYKQGADYLGCGAVFGSTTKNNVQHISPEILRQVTSAVPIPVVAIGGINLENLPLLKNCDLAGAAIVSAIFAQSDITEASRELLGIINTL